MSYNYYMRISTAIAAVAMVLWIGDKEMFFTTLWIMTIVNLIFPYKPPTPSQESSDET